MYWEEQASDEIQVSRAVIDIVYHIRCKTLPVDHAHALYSALVAEIPWLQDEPRAGVHPIQVPESGNGWLRPENPGDLMHLSRRTRLCLRVPEHRIPEAMDLAGKKLEVAGHAFEIVDASERALSTLTTVFSRFVVFDKDGDETEFLRQAHEALAIMGVHPKKMMPGRAKTIQTPEKMIKTRSLMLAELSPEASVRLQQEGLGEHRHLGCGIFIPHKDIATLSRVDH